ncbi:MAG: hypothetical protein EOO87_17565 [Pedobacter sp.]|nr:MAG: hypothetical protein EOO87_17565 [Pedobacter sp.]
MKNIKLKKNQLKSLISDVIKLEKNNPLFFVNDGILDYIDLDFGVHGFKVLFKPDLPEQLVKDLDLIIRNYSINDN